MTALVPTTTVSLLRGTTTDDYGDEADVNAAPIAIGVPIAITETSKRAFVPGESRTTVVRMLTGRVRPEVDVQTGDRARDEIDGVTYLVEGVTQLQSPFGAVDKRLDLRRVDR